MIAQIAAGIGMQFQRSARLASLILGVVYLAFSLACIPDILAAKNIYERFGGSFLLFFSMSCGAIALFAASESNAARARVFGRVAALDSASARFPLRWVRHSFFAIQPDWFQSGSLPAKCFGQSSPPSPSHSPPLPYSSIARHDSRYASSLLCWHSSEYWSGFRVIAHQRRISTGPNAF